MTTAGSSCCAARKGHPQRSKRMELPDADGPRGGGAVVGGAGSGGDLELVGAAAQLAAALFGGGQGDGHDAVAADDASCLGDDVAVEQQAELDELRSLGGEDEFA